MQFNPIVKVLTSYYITFLFYYLFVYLHGITNEKKVGQVFHQILYLIG